MKKKVGILSMQRVINYGSFLQAYALRQLLLNLGAGSVDFVDIIPGKELVKYESSSLKKRLRTVFSLASEGNLITGIKDFLHGRKLAKTIRQCWPILKLDNPDNTTFDLTVIGSDEVFNCTQSVAWGFSTQLFGNIPKSVSKEVATYAASFGHTNMADLDKYGLCAEIAKYLSKMQDISVRDLNSQNIIEQLIGIKPPIHLDPVLAYGYKDEINEMTDRPMDEPYMVIYSYQGRISDNEEVHAIRDYAKTRGLKLISIMTRYNWCDKAVFPETPFDVLRWFKFADCIVTDTFHGTIFSIITHSNFATFIRPSNRNKLHYLLAMLNLTSHEVDSSGDLGAVLSMDNDYAVTEDILLDFRSQTKKYLGNLISF